MEVKSQKLLSAKICLNLKFLGVGVGGVFYGSQKSKTSKCQDLPKFEFLVCVCVGGGYSMEVKSQKLSAKICLKLNFSGGGGYSMEVKSQNF